MFIAGIIVCIRGPKNGIALGLFRYRNDNGSKTVLRVGFSVLDLSFVQYWRVVLYKVQVEVYELILVDY